MQWPPGNSFDRERERERERERRKMKNIECFDNLQSENMYTYQDTGLI